MRLILVCLFLEIVLANSAGGQELSTAVYPSEDEVYEAWVSSEIDLAQFQILMELSNQKIDTTESHLLDQLPNLSYSLNQSRTLTTALQKEQLASFQQRLIDASRVHGYLTHQYTVELESEGRNRYRTSARFLLGDKFRAGLKLQREYSGRERFTHRYVTYKSSSGTMREITLGNFTKRFGLGTIIGYRGKLLDRSNELDGESFLFPDYGGSNGLYLRGNRGRHRLELLGSIARDDEFDVQVAGVMYQYRADRWKPSLIIARNRVRRRSTDETQTYGDVGVNMQYQYTDGHVEGEISFGGDKVATQVVLLEGSHRFRDAQVIYSGWHYNDNFHDLSSGSKKVSLTQGVVIPEVRFSYITRRSGQDGMMLKTIVGLTDDLDIVNSAVVASIPHNKNSQELLSGIVGRFGNNWSIRADLNLERYQKTYLNGERIDKGSRTRIEARYNNGNLSARSYIAHNSESGREDYLSWLVRARFRLPGDGTAEIWSNVSRIDPGSGKIDYWYVYLRHEQELTPGLRIAIKLSRTYDRSTNESARMVGQVELTAAL